MNRPRPVNRNTGLFKVEADVQFFLTEHLFLLEQGLHLYNIAEFEGFEFPCLGRRLDILAEDRFTGLLAIEVKFKTAEPAALGQVIGYIAAIRRMKKFAGRYVRGAIVCRKADQQLMLAAEDLGYVSIYEWSPGPTFTCVLSAHDAIHIPE